jgi:hypothetical protein
MKNAPTFWEGVIGGSLAQSMFNDAKVGTPHCGVRLLNPDIAAPYPYRFQTARGDIRSIRRSQTARSSFSVYLRSLLFKDSAFLCPCPKSSTPSKALQTLPTLSKGMARGEASGGNDGLRPITSIYAYLRLLTPITALFQKKKIVYFFGKRRQQTHSVILSKIRPQPKSTSSGRKSGQK